MAGIDSARRHTDTAIPASQQFAAVAYLRWCLFRNGFRRKGGRGELAARIFVFPIAAIFVFGPMVGSFAGTYAAVKSDSLATLALIFFGIFLLQIIVSINISTPGLSFDPESLIRYPVTFPRYLTIRLFLGLLSASTVVGTLCLLASALAVAIAEPSLGPIAFAAACSLAVANMLFTRMIFAWIDRWLSTRRAREIFTVLIFVFSIGIQYANVTFNNLGHKTNHAQQKAKIEAALRFYHAAQPYVMALPPGLAGGAIQRAHEGAGGRAALEVSGVLLYALVFLAVFAWRMQREYRGENLSEGSVHNSQVVASAVRRPNGTQAVARREVVPVPANSMLQIPPVIGALLEKEWLYVRRNPAQFYGLIAPLAMVFIFAGRLGSFARTGMIFPAAAAYSILGIAALAYNLLGMDAAGVQFYFLAPIQIRTVMLAKNIFGFVITGVQLTVLYLLLCFTSGPPPLVITVGTLCWVAFAALVNASVGNIRSIIAPKKVDPSKISRKQASQLSALMSLGLMLGVGALGAGLFALATFLKIAWLPIPILLAFAVGAFALYSAGLSRLDTMAMNHRETLIEELSKVSV